MIRSKFNTKMEKELTLGQVLSVERYYRPEKNKIRLANTTTELSEIEAELDTKKSELETEYSYVPELAKLLDSFRIELKILIDAKKKTLTSD